MDIYQNVEISEQEESRMFHDCIFVLDTSAICGLYNLTDHYRSIMVDILTSLNERIWIPNQVKVEYLRNRKKSISNPKTEKYRIPAVVNNKLYCEVQDLIKIWEGNKYYHPYLDDNEIKKIKKSIEDANKHIRIVKETIKEQYKKRITEIESIESKDILLDFVNKLNVGNPLDYCQIKEIIKEGEFRYRNLLPPGYCDREKNGIEKYGDLIIWKGIIDYAKQYKKDIILISDDCKEDWVFLNGENKGKPRNELIAEFYEESQRHFLMYTMAQFIEQVKKQFHENQDIPLFEELENVAYVLHRIANEKTRAHSKLGEKILYKCKNCGNEFESWSEELGLEWENSVNCERGMGEEILWSSEGYVCCPHCGQQIDVSLEIYEYPVGIHNYGSINCENGDIINNPNMESISPVNYYYGDRDVCERCGEYAIINHNGLCDNCQYDFDRFINSDD